jgi:hypothetical protein
VKIKLLIASALTFLGCGQANNKTADQPIGQPTNNKLNMDINKGSQIDSPKIFVPWDVEEKELTDLFNGHELKHVTTGYYTTSCTSLNGLTCMLGFHFDPRSNGRLNELEFFRTNYDDQRKSFEEFQTHFVNVFGQPSETAKGNEGFNNYAWQLNNVQIVHYIFDRFGPEEHMRIKKAK